MNYWIQKTGLKKGALHRQLGISPGKKIPYGKLARISHAKVGTKIDNIRVTPLLKRRVNLAKNLRKLR